LLVLSKVSQVENVYDEVEEHEYSDRVQKRLDDDWIEDDGEVIFLNCFNICNIKNSKTADNVVHKVSFTQIACTMVCARWGLSL